MTRAFISVGSNIEPEKNIRDALSLLSNEAAIAQISTVYLTDAIDRPFSPQYYNCVVEIETDMTPSALKNDVLRRIEASCGRKRFQNRYADRTIDLDLIIYDDLIMNRNGLLLPDPDILGRPFLALSLYELDAHMVIFGLGPLGDITTRFRDIVLKPLPDYTEHLRKEIPHGHAQG